MSQKTEAVVASTIGIDRVRGGWRPGKNFLTFLQH